MLHLSELIAVTETQANGMKPFVFLGVEHPCHKPSALLLVEEAKGMWANGAPDSAVVLTLARSLEYSAGVDSKLHRQFLDHADCFAAMDAAYI